MENRYQGDTMSPTFDAKRVLDWLTNPAPAGICDTGGPTACEFTVYCEDFLHCIAELYQQAAADGGPLQFGRTAVDSVSPYVVTGPSGADQLLIVVTLDNGISLASRPIKPADLSDTDTDTGTDLAVTVLTNIHWHANDLVDTWTGVDQ